MLSLANALNQEFYGVVTINEYRKDDPELEANDKSVIIRFPQRTSEMSDNLFCELIDPETGELIRNIMWRDNGYKRKHTEYASIKDKYYGEIAKLRGRERSSEYPKALKDAIKSNFVSKEYLETTIYTEHHSIIDEVCRRYGHVIIETIPERKRNNEDKKAFDLFHIDRFIQSFHAIVDNTGGIRRYGYRLTKRDYNPDGIVDI